MNPTIEYVSNRITALPRTNASNSCLGLRLKRKICGLCAESCPADAISLQESEIAIDADACLGCGTCSAVCPSGHIIDAGRQIASVLSKNALRQDALVIHCSAVPQSALPEQTDEHLTHTQVRCLSALPWEALALCAQQGPTIIARGLCSQCESALLEKRVRAQASAARRFCESTGDAARLRFLKANTAKSPRQDNAQGQIGATSRRGFLAWIKTQVKSEASLVSEEILPSKHRRAIRRQLAENTKKRCLGGAAERTRVRWPVPMITGDCIGCNICAALCPSKAIRTVSEPGTGLFQHVRVDRCTCCTLCARICPHKAIECPTYQEAPVNETCITRLIATDTCDVCGGFSAALADIDGEQLCPVCTARVKANRGQKPDSVQRAMIAEAQRKREEKRRGELAQ